MNYYNLNLSTTVNENPLFNFYFDSLYQTIWQLGHDYPGFSDWYYKKVKNGIRSGEREIVLTIVNDYIAGVAILKKVATEKKICTLRVLDGFQRNGLGSSLVLESLDFLDTEKPLITINSNKHTQFCRLFNYYGFEKTTELAGHYTHSQKEITYNGSL